MNIEIHQNDLPDINVSEISSIAVDTETTGLNIGRDRLCVVQICLGDPKKAYLVQFYGKNNVYDAPNLKKILLNNNIEKIFHFARFDIAVLEHFLRIKLNNIFCTKIASKLTRTFTERHSLKDLVKEVIGIELSKQQQTSNWGEKVLTGSQKEYAASDVIYLHRIKTYLSDLLEREERLDLATQCFNFLPTRARLDLLKWDENKDFFAHS